MHQENPILLVNLSDRLLVDFMRCPFRFYWQHIKKQDQSQHDWRVIVQHIVNRIINDYYQIPLNKRSAFQVLQLIEKHWRIGIDSFDSKQHYYTTLAKITDYLVQNLHRSEGLYPPVFLDEKMSVYSEELQTQLTLTLQVGHWTEKSYSIKKYLVSDEREIIEFYRNFMILFCYEAFHELPECIEIISLLDGKSTLIFPDKLDVQKARDYLRLFSNALKEPASYVKSNSPAVCGSCPLYTNCTSGDEKKVNIGGFIP